MEVLDDVTYQQRHSLFKLAGGGPARYIPLNAANPGRVVALENITVRCVWQHVQQCIPLCSRIPPFVRVSSSVPPPPRLPTPSLC